MDLVVRSTAEAGRSSRMSQRLRICRREQFEQTYQSLQSSMGPRLRNGRAVHPVRMRRPLRHLTLYGDWSSADLEQTGVQGITGLKPGRLLIWRMPITGKTDKRPLVQQATKQSERTGFTGAKHFDLCPWCEDIPRTALSRSTPAPRPGCPYCNCLRRTLLSASTIVTVTRMTIRTADTCG